MRHLDDTELADIALRGLASLEPEVRRHVEDCPDCADEAAAFSSIGSAARSGDALESPPSQVWERIVGELGDELPGPVDPSASHFEPMGDSPRPEDTDTTGPEGQADDSSVPQPETSAVDTPEQARPVRRRAEGQSSRRTGRAGTARPGDRTVGRKRARRWIAGAAVASFVLGAAVAVGVGQLVSRDSTDVVEQASLDPLPGWDVRGTARVEDADGKLQLIVDLPDNSVPGFREVWLLDLEGETPGLLSVGTLNGDQGIFDLPPDVDLAKYSVVDISSEPFDGDPAHSTDSIVRGELGALG